VLSIKSAEKLVQLRDRLYELGLEVEHIRREVDSVANELIEQLKQQGLVRKAPVE
jgi:hypothetical protein